MWRLRRKSWRSHSPTHKRLFSMSRRGGCGGGNASWDGLRSPTLMKLHHLWRSPHPGKRSSSPTPVRLLSFLSCGGYEWESSGFSGLKSPKTKKVYRHAEFVAPGTALERAHARSAVEVIAQGRVRVRKLLRKPLKPAKVRRSARRLPDYFQEYLRGHRLVWLCH